MSTYSHIFSKHKYNLDEVVSKSKRWYEQQIRIMMMSQINPTQLITTSPKYNTAVVTPGNLYLFQYDPKYKDKLPVWDEFPLVFPFNKFSEGFIGLNMHYLPYPERIKLLDSLMGVSINSIENGDARLKLSWSLISGFAKFKSARVCVKRYDRNHVKTMFKKIPSNDWSTAMMLPVEKFNYK